MIENQENRSVACEVGDHVILIYPAGMQATATIMTEKLQELKSIMTADDIFLMQEMRSQAMLGIVEEIVQKIGIHAYTNQMETGVFDAIYKLCKENEIGIFLDPEQILLLDPTRFICKHFGINPFRIPSKECRIVIVKASKGELLIERLKQSGIPAKVIGEVVQGNEPYYVINDMKLPVAEGQEDEMSKLQ